MHQRRDRNQSVEKVRAGVCDGLDDIRDRGPDLKCLISIEHPKSPVNLKIARQYSEDISKWTERIPRSGLRIALAAGNQQRGMSLLGDACELAHQARLSAARISHEKHRHGISGQSLLQTSFQP